MHSNFIPTKQVITLRWFTWPMAMCSPWRVSTGSTNRQKYFFPTCLSVTPTSRLKNQSSFCAIRYSKAIYQMVKLATVSAALQPSTFDLFFLDNWKCLLFCSDTDAALYTFQRNLKLLWFYAFPNFIHFPMTCQLWHKATHILLYTAEF